MNILIIGNAYPPTYMGGESIHLYNLSVGLKKRGHNLHVVHPVPSSGPRGTVTLSRREDNIEVYSIGLPEGGDYLDRLNHTFLGIFEKLCKEGKRFDLVHCHSNRFFSSTDTFTKRYSIPLVTTVHAIHIAMVHDLINRKGTPVEAQELATYRADIERQKAICAASDRVIGISRAMASLIVKHFDTDSRKVRHVYNGIDVDLLTHFSGERPVDEIRNRLAVGEKTVILFAGRIEPIKGIQPMAAAFRALGERYDQTAFIFLGNGSGDPWLRDYLSGCRNVHFIDWVSFDGLIPYYYLADIVVVPSLIEPFGLVAVEAMACGACVISTNADGLDEIITHKVNGVKIPLVLDKYGDRSIRADDIYNALEKCVLDSGWRKALADQGLQRAKDFRLDDMIEGVEKVYGELSD